MHLTTVTNFTALFKIKIDGKMQFRRIFRFDREGGQWPFFFCSSLLRCDLLAKKVPGRAPFSQHIIIRNWT